MGFQCGAPAANQNAIPVMIPVGTRQREIMQSGGRNYLCKCDLAGYEMEICRRGNQELRPCTHQGTAANITFCPGNFQGPILTFEVNVQ